MKAMPLAEDVKNIVENIISSYEARIQSIEALFDTTHQFLRRFQDSFLNTKEEREKINIQLREILAKNEHLRKKDFDNIMQGILSTQVEREREVRNLLKTYINEQKGMAHTSRDNLAKVKDAFTKGEIQRVKDFQDMTKEILVQQDARKEEVTSKLKEFQREQQEMAKRLRGLLAKGKELRTKDLKLMLKAFKTQHKERIARQEERKEEVLTMLGDCKKERLEAANNLRSVKKKMAQRRANETISIDVRQSKGRKA